MQLKLEKKFGQSPVFVASARMENGGMARNASPACLLKEAIQVISCGYEDKTEWGKEVRYASPVFSTHFLVEGLQFGFRFGFFVYKIIRYHIYFGLFGFISNYIYIHIL